MRDRWQRTPLGDVTKQIVSPVTVEDKAEYVSLGLRMYAGGVFAREPKKGTEIKAPRLFKVRPGQFIYNRLFASGGSFGLVRPEHAEAVVSNEFPVFDLDTSRLHPEFLYLHFQQRSVWDTVAEQCIGTTKTRLRWKEGRFSEYAVLLPSLAEQERIVDLIAALDNTIQTAQASSLIVLDLRNRFLESQFIGGRLTRIGSLVEGIFGGRSPKASDVPPTDAQFGVLKVSAVTSLGFRPSQAKTVDDATIFQPSHVVRQGDVLITRANTAALVGQVCMVEQEYQNLFLCDKTLRLVPREGITPATLTAALNSPQARRQLSAAATGTSASMKNISQPNIRDVLLPWPRDSEMVGDVDQQFLTAHRGLQDLVARLQVTRANLLSALLSGAHQIPDSYDDLSEEAA